MRTWRRTRCGYPEHSASLAVWHGVHGRSCVCVCVCRGSDGEYVSCYHKQLPYTLYSHIHTSLHMQTYRLGRAIPSMKSALPKTCTDVAPAAAVHLCCCCCCCSCACVVFRQDLCFLEPLPAAAAAVAAALTSTSRALSKANGVMPS